MGTFQGFLVDDIVSHLVEATHEKTANRQRVSVLVLASAFVHGGLPVLTEQW